ncbi:hypothetical protein [Kitasatospora sp. NPDC006786]|uniref:hypothetical protein n=1 Tax=unclassified Kitasatospora TaxID=2633591 RepID=UPI0033C6845D
MSDRIPCDRQGQWRKQRGLGSRGPTRVPAHPPMPLPMPLPDGIAAPEESEQRPSGKGTGRLGEPPPDGPTPTPPADPPR